MPTVLMREIGAMGYRGGISQLKAYLHEFKVVRADPVVRFETAPGQQMQADFTTIRRGRDRLLAFVATLGFSRATFVRFTRSELFADCAMGWSPPLITSVVCRVRCSSILFPGTKSMLCARDPLVQRAYAEC